MCRLLHRILQTEWFSQYTEDYSYMGLEGKYPVIFLDWVNLGAHGGAVVWLDWILSI
jgi:hypothetical protein